MSIVITDVDDPRVDGFRNLPARSDLRGDTIIVESELAVQRLLESRVTAEAVLVVEKRQPFVTAPAGTPVYTCSQAVLDRIVGFSMHRGAIALARRPQHDIATLTQTLADTALLVCASNVSDPSNLGALARNARALGAAGLLIDARGGDIYARKAIRTSMGNVFALPVVVADLTPAIAALRRAAPDLCVTAATLGPTAIDIATFTAPKRTLVILGNEGAGVSPDVLANVDVELTIPMQSGADSLNVAAASAIFLYALAHNTRK